MSPPVLPGRVHAPGRPAGAPAEAWPVGPPAAGKEGNRRNLQDHPGPARGSAAGDRRPATGLRQFDSWAAQVLRDKHQEARVPPSPGPEDAVLYAEGYLEQRSALQPGRARQTAETKKREYLWHYHLGRTMPWNGAGNDPRVPPGFQQALKDKWAITPDSSRKRANGESAFGASHSENR